MGQKIAVIFALGAVSWVPVFLILGIAWVITWAAQ